MRLTRTAPRRPSRTARSSAAKASPRVDARVWQPDVTVACVIARQGRLLMVEERVNGQVVLNQPAGHLEPDETLEAAAIRETLEETGWQVRLTNFIGTYQWTAPDTGRHYLRFAFVAQAVAHHAEQALDDGIVRAVWMTPEELQAQRERHRSPLVWQAIGDFLAGSRHSLDLLRRLP